MILEMYRYIVQEADKYRNQKKIKQLNDRRGE